MKIVHKKQMNHNNILTHHNKNNKKNNKGNRINNKWVRMNNKLKNNKIDVIKKYKIKIIINLLLNIYILFIEKIDYVLNHH